MSTLALGNPVVTYAYQYDAKGSAFNKAFYNILSPGIYQGGGLSFSGNQVIVSAYDALFPYASTSQLIAVHTNSSINLSLATGSGGYGLGNITPALPYIAMYFTWTDQTAVYPDYGFYDASIVSNASYLILGKGTFSGSTLTGFDYNYSTLPAIYSAISRVFQIKGTTETSSPSTGSLVVQGGVGIAKGLNVGGSITSPNFVSTIATGTSPLTIDSTTKVTNLNSDLLDNYHASTTASPNTIPVYNASSKLVGSITGTAPMSLFCAGYPPIAQEYGARRFTGQIYTASSNGYVLMKITAYCNIRLYINNTVVWSLEMTDGMYRTFFPVQSGMTWEVGTTGTAAISWVDA